MNQLVQELKPPLENPLRKVCTTVVKVNIPRARRWKPLPGLSGSVICVSAPIMSSITFAPRSFSLQKITEDQCLKQRNETEARRFTYLELKGRTRTATFTLKRS